MENRTIKTTIGKLNIADVALVEDSLEIFIPVIEIEENLKDIIEENIQAAMEEFQTNVLDEHGLKWSDAGVTVDLWQLHIILTENNVEYELCINFSDWENKALEWDCKLEVDLSEHTTELKQLARQVVMEKFFS